MWAAHILLLLLYHLSFIIYSDLYMTLDQYTFQFKIRFKKKRSKLNPIHAGVNQSY